MLSASRDFMFRWIPAFAGMTKGAGGDDEPVLAGADHARLKA
jgi:hypothetical protein